MQILRLSSIAVAALIAASTSSQSLAAPPPRVATASEAEHPSTAFDTLPLHAPEAGPATAPTVGIFMTGDGGWAPFDTAVSADMSRAGVPTVGFDTGAYFDTLRTPEEAAGALGQAISATMEKYHAQHVILVGYSFGADIAPFLVNRLPEHMRVHIDRIALMSPSDTASFQVTLLERAGLETPGARPVVSELRKAGAQGHRIVCLYGKNDPDAICAKADIPAMRVVEMRGGHGLHGNHQAVADAIRDAWPMES